MSSETTPIMAPGQRQAVGPEYPIYVYDSQLAHPGRPQTDTSYFRDSPLKLILFDLGVVLRHAPQLRNVLRPFHLLADLTVPGLLLQAVFILVSLIMTTLGVVSLVTGLPPTPILVVVAITLVVIIMSRLQGKVKPDRGEEDKFPDEAWLYVNGIATSNSGLQLSLTHLNKIFHRRVTGIHNKTFGLWWDLIECLLQRDFMWVTEDVRVGYQTICGHIKDSKKKKVVLIAHSQGGIIMSAWIDQLLADFPADALHKVEVYTFACAANHFSNPSYPIIPETPHSDSEHEDAVHAEAKGTGSRQEGRRFVFGIVEHFANTKDYVSLIGLLQFAPPTPAGLAAGELPPYAAEGRFAGRFFKREGHTGHLLSAHYLKAGDSILDHRTVLRYSQLVKYKDGQRSEAEERLWKPTVDTGANATAPAPAAAQ